MSLPQPEPTAGRRAIEGEIVQALTRELDVTQLERLASRLNGSPVSLGNRRAAVDWIAGWAAAEYARGHGETWVRRNVLAGVRNVLLDRIDALQREIAATRVRVSQLNLKLAEE